MSELKRMVPEEILKVKGWCLERKRWDEYNFMDSIIQVAQRGEKIDNIRKIRLENLLQEYRLMKKTQDIRNLFTR